MSKRSNGVTARPPAIGAGVDMGGNLVAPRKHPDLLEGDGPVGGKLEHSQVGGVHKLNRYRLTYRRGGTLRIIEVASTCEKWELALTLRDGGHWTDSDGGSCYIFPGAMESLELLEDGDWEADQ